MNIICIDPGTTATGLVYMSELSIVCHETVTGKSVRTDQYELLERLRYITRKVLAFMADKPHEAVIMEGFVGFTGRQNAFTFQTPALVFYMLRALEHAGENIVIQTSDRVLRPGARGSVIQECDVDEHKGRNSSHTKVNALRRIGWKGWESLTNDHVRAAALHGIYYYEHKEGR